MIYRLVTPEEVVVRIVAAALIGGIIGVDRALKNRPAGLRTYMLVCIGSCLIMLTNQYIYQCTGAGDPMRLGAQVVSGIGFLGAGTIVVTRRSHIKGLTTAAGLWSAAGVGLALGIGFYEAAVAAACAIFVVMTIMQKLDNRMHRSTRSLEIYVELSHEISLGTFIHCVREKNLEITDIQNDGDGDGGLGNGQRAFVATLRAEKRQNHLMMMEEVRKIEGVLHLETL